MRDGFRLTVLQRAILEALKPYGTKPQFASQIRRDSGAGMGESSVYTLLERLLRRKLVRRLPERVKNRKYKGPPHALYCISATGKKALMQVGRAETNQEPKADA